jgi:hypothetical protein
MKLMDILIEAAYQQDEIATRTKEPHSWGAMHYIYKTNDHAKLIKVGPEETVDQWYDLFSSYPNLFAKVFKRGKTKFKMRDGSDYIGDYVMVEKLDVRAFKSLWFHFEKACDRYQDSIGKYDHDSFQYYITRIEDNMEFIRGMAKSMEHDPHLHNKFVQFVNLLLDIYELKPAADVHIDQFGIDGEGKIKCLDI